MFTRNMEDKFKELKNYFKEKFLSQEKCLTCKFNPLINDLKAETIKEIKRKVSKQHGKWISKKINASTAGVWTA